jgi:hypothetical protein
MWTFGYICGPGHTLSFRRMEKRLHVTFTSNSACVQVACTYHVSVFLLSFSQL